MEDIPAFALLSLGSLALGEASGYMEPERELGSPMEMSTWQKTKAACQKLASTCQSVSILEQILLS